MAKSKAAASGVPIDSLPKEEIMATKTTKAYRDVEVPLCEVQPLCISMNPKLLKAARLGDMKLLDELLQSKDFSIGASLGEIAITVSEHDTTQEDTNWLLGVTCEGNTAFHIVVSRGHLEFATKICHREFSLLTAPNKRLDTPLHCAARAGNDKMVSHIIQLAREGEIEKEELLRATNKNKNNALHEAAKYNHVHVAKVLMEEDIELASMLNDVGMSPFYLAIVSGSLKVAKDLLQFSSWKKAEFYQGPNNKTALHAAVVISQEIMKDILKQEPTLAKVADHLQRLPLHYAALSGHSKMVKLLLKHNPSAAYLSDCDGLCPIHIAAAMGNIPAIDEILEWCPDTDELLDEEGKNFLHVAFQRRRLDVVKKIISRRPDLKKLLNDQDNEGNTPLHTAVENGDQRSAHFLLRDKIVHVNIINHNGFTPLDLASAKSDGGLRFRMNVANCILSSLAFIKALPSLPRHPFKKAVSSSDEDKKKSAGDDEVKENSSNVKKELEITKRWCDEEMKEWEDVPKNFVIATALIATVTFTAGLTVPGGYIADDHLNRGTAVLAKEYAFKVFLVSDAVAFACSFLATFWLIQAGILTIDRYTRRRHLHFAEECLWVAFNGISTAFAMGVYATLVSSYKSISILLCIIALGIPILANVVSRYNVYSFMITVGIRQGYRHWIWPTTIYPHVKINLRPKLVPCGTIIRYMLSGLGSYVVLFLLPKLLAWKN